MRISFEFEDTLICCNEKVPRERDRVPFFQKKWFNEPLRLGTQNLLLELQARGCDIWIYTTSYRSENYIKSLFKFYGITISGVIDGQRNIEEIYKLFVQRKPNPRKPSKYPPAFGIDLHIDDSENLIKEAQEFNFDVVIVNPQDEDWTKRVIEAVNQKN
jgi:hypothetical protein